MRQYPILKREVRVLLCEPDLAIVVGFERATKILYEFIHVTLESLAGLAWIIFFLAYLHAGKQ